MKTQNKEKNINNFQKITNLCKTSIGFTLTELIVVISILAILGTISYTKLSEFPSIARDASRVSDIVNIAKLLTIIQTKIGTYPLPEKFFFCNLFWMNSLASMNYW